MQFKFKAGSFSEKDTRGKGGRDALSQQFLLSEMAAKDERVAEQNKKEKQLLQKIFSLNQKHQQLKSNYILLYSAKNALNSQVVQLEHRANLQAHQSARLNQSLIASQDEAKSMFESLAKQITQLGEQLIIERNRVCDYQQKWLVLLNECGTLRAENQKLQQLNSELAEKCQAGSQLQAQLRNEFKRLQQQSLMQEWQFKESEFKSLKLAQDLRLEIAQLKSRLAKAEHSSKVEQMDKELSQKSQQLRRAESLHLPLQSRVDYLEAQLTFKEQLVDRFKTELEKGQQGRLQTEQEQLNRASKRGKKSRRIRLPRMQSRKPSLKLGRCRKSILSRRSVEMSNRGH